ncbi:MULTISPECIES: hypothetical protein [unclassified Mesorhizobium]|uniref:hypothetical protein n=1 Tax=unclassified Mesorhizobium TaxID=325217 RepID=UPI0013E4038C|nr:MULTISPECIES: hypothetical protein [unclassified Mesorhizobium]
MAYEREPTLDEILNEPIISKIMTVDGYSSDDIRYLMHQARATSRTGGTRPDRCA